MAGKFSVAHAGFGRWRVVDEHGQPVSEDTMPKKEAEQAAQAANTEPVQVLPAKEHADLDIFELRRRRNPSVEPSSPKPAEPLSFMVVPAGNSLWSVICEQTGMFVVTSAMPRKEAEALASAITDAYAENAVHLDAWPQDIPGLLKVAMQLFGLSEENLVRDAKGKPVANYYKQDQETHVNNLGVTEPLPVTERGMFSFVAEWKQIVEQSGRMVIATFRDKLALNTTVDPKFAAAAKMSRRDVTPVHI